VVPISYDAIFEGFRTRWMDPAGALASVEIVAGTAVHGALTRVADQGDDALKQVSWEKVLDVLLWTTNPSVLLRIDHYASPAGRR
jgi:hypothetical protein